jgi:hypothetical protein
MFNFFKTNKIHLIKAILGLVGFVIAGILSFKLYTGLTVFELSHETRFFTTILTFGISYLAVIYFFVIRNKIKHLVYQELPKGLLPTLIVCLSIMTGGLIGMSLFAIGKVYHLEGFISLIQYSALPPLMLMYVNAGSIYSYSKNRNSFYKELINFLSKFCVLNTNTTFKQV